MGDSKQWTVTYTKHIKQKRKVYQDGFLELQISSSKVALYDECEKLLESRLLKNDETVASGETLVFNGYLVDIGDPEGGHKPESYLNVDRKHTKRFITPDTKINAKENNVRARKLPSPSQQMIKEFKKRELLKYGSPKISETQKPSTTEWQVLYTTQVTQKAKKYHDGYLQLVLRGSRGAHVMLFDTNRKLIDSRFLKKDDVIKPGESIAFDSYLIDIGELQGNHAPDSSVLGDKCANVESIKMDRQKTSLDTSTSVAVGKSEWKVLYTTQLTQKAKKYHDGFLQLEFCGSHGRQVVLCDLSKKSLERRFLKKDEVIRAGDLVYFDGHLVEVGELEGSHHSPVKLNERGTANSVVERRQLIGLGQNGCHKVNPSDVKGKPPRELCLRQDSVSNSIFTETEETKLNRTAPPIKPFRDAKQILSSLQDPNRKPQERCATGVLLPGASQDIADRESNEAMRSLDITSSEVSAAECSAGTFQLTENAKMGNQSHSQKDTQTNMSEIFISKSGCHSCLITNEGQSGEELSSKRETFPSFDLGF